MTWPKETGHGALAWGHLETAGGSTCDVTQCPWGLSSKMQTGDFSYEISLEWLDVLRQPVRLVKRY